MYTEAIRAQALELSASGLSYMRIVRVLADQGEDVSRTTVIRWIKDSQPIEAEWTPTFNDQLQAVRDILDGNNAPDWMDQKIFVDLSKSLAIAENQHRLSNVRQTETGLTRPHATAFIRRILLEVGKAVPSARGLSAGSGPPGLDRMDQGGGGRVQHHLGEGFMIMGKDRQWLMAYETLRMLISLMPYAGIQAVGDAQYTNPFHPRYVRST